MDQVYEPFETVYNRVEFEYSPADDQPRLCEYAQAFSIWVELLNQDIITTTPTPVSVNQAKVLLLDQYFAVLSNTPKKHYKCIENLFEQTYFYIRRIELSMIPPLLFIPKPPPPPPMDGLYFGDVVGEGE